MSVNPWPRDITAAKNAFYGDFHSRGWASVYLVRIKPPFHMYYEKKLLPTGILVNKMCANAMLAAFEDIWDSVGRDQTAVDKTGASDYGGCFNIRPIAGSNNYSNHSWACAIDLSPETNGFRYTPGTTLDTIVVDAFKHRGARWGGDYHGRKDPMHFEFVSP